MDAIADDITPLVKVRARQFVSDNGLGDNPRTLLLIESAMLIGAAMVFEVEANKTKDA